jgi:hypothetical protein
MSLAAMMPTGGASSRDHAPTLAGGVSSDNEPLLSPDPRLRIETFVGRGLGDAVEWIPISATRVETIVRVACAGKRETRRELRRAADHGDRSVRLMGGVKATGPNSSACARPRNGGQTAAPSNPIAVASVWRGAVAAVASRAATSWTLIELARRVVRSPADPVAGRDHPGGASARSRRAGNPWLQPPGVSPSVQADMNRGVSPIHLPVSCQRRMATVRSKPSPSMNIAVRSSLRVASGYSVSSGRRSAAAM